jgi:hypothetical protein
MTDSARPACPPAPRLRRLALVALLALFGVLALAVLSGCSDDPPPERTLAQLGATVGDAKLDDTDFPALVQDYTVPEYGEDVSAEMGNYQLYLTGKAADIALNQPEPPDLVEVESDKGRNESRVSFNFSRKEGLFAVADISKIDVRLVKTDDEQLPWRIRGITLGR